MASRIGEVEEIQLRLPTGFFGEFVRVKVSIDINAKIKRFVTGKKGDERVRYQAKYEKLPTFCFNCGEFGHCQLKEIIPSETHIGRRRADLRHPMLDDGVDVGGARDWWKERRGLTAAANGGELGSDLMGPSVEREHGVDDVPPPLPAVVVPLLETPDWMGG
ncbi:putative disease resistance protein RGA3 [Hordeum vulgare]|nr:putative disease resistance protein RGA3 [Hordeum vulgare]